MEKSNVTAIDLSNLMDMTINGTDSFLETYYNAVIALTEKSYDEHCSDKVRDIYHDTGIGGMYDLAKDLTVKFEKEYKDVIWGEDLDFYDTFEKFIERELY